VALLYITLPQVYDVVSSSLVATGPLPLSASATLAWLGFSEEGWPAAADSAGIIRVRTPDFGGSWAVVFDSIKQSTGGEVFWTVGLGHGKVTCITCPPAHPYPKVS
jgi:chromosome transmission fidelity protein 4